MATVLTEVLQVRLTESEKQQIVRAALESGTTQSAIVRGWIREQEAQR